MINIRQAPAQRNPITGEGIAAKDLQTPRGKKIARVAQNSIPHANHQKQEGAHPPFPYICSNPITGGLNLCAKGGYPTGKQIPLRPLVTVTRRSRFVSLFHAMVRNPITGLGMFTAESYVGKRVYPRHSAISRNVITNRGIEQADGCLLLGGGGTRKFPSSRSNPVTPEDLTDMGSLIPRGKKAVTQSGVRDPISGRGMPLSFDCLRITRWDVKQNRKFTAPCKMIKRSKLVRNWLASVMPKTACASIPATVSAVQN